jgi:hypothetical protein
MQEVEEGPDRRGLAGAVGSEEPEHLSGADGHRDVVDAARRAVALGQRLGRDDGSMTAESGPRPARSIRGLPQPTSGESAMTGTARRGTLAA